jgi:D-alanyl-D-alanine carboxypeptidase
MRECFYVKPVSLGRCWARTTALAAVFLSVGAAPVATPAPAATSAPAASPIPLDTAARERIDADVTAILKTLRGTGATIEIVERDGSTYVRGYGLRDVARGLPAQAGTQYEIGSITKQFTAAAILQLKSAGKLKLDDRLAAYLPNAPHAREVTIRQLLSHTSGVPEYLDGPHIVSRAAKPATFAQLMALVAKKPLDFKPGTKFEYSNTTYIILGRVVEVVSKQPYEAYVREHLFAPAGMTQTATMADESRLPDMARGYTQKDGKTIPASPLDDSFAWSAGNIVSTVEDLERWNVALSSGKIIPAADYALMTTPVRLPNGASTDYGFGMVADSFEGQPRVWHNGGTFGFAATNQFFPNLSLHVIAFTNDGNGPDAAIAAKIFNDLNPTIAASDLAAAPGEDPAVTARIKAFILPALKGHLDRSLITDAANKALPEAAIKSVADQLAPLGDPTGFIYKSVTQRPAGPVYVYLVVYGSQTLKLTIQIEKASDKFSLFFISPQ